jgi:hypothetical protein
MNRTHETTAGAASAASDFRRKTMSEEPVLFPTRVQMGELSEFVHNRQEFAKILLSLAGGRRDCWMEMPSIDRCNPGVIVLFPDEYPAHVGFQPWRWE